MLEAEGEERRFCGEYSHFLDERHTRMWSGQMGPPLQYRERERPGLGGVRI
jgi:hypothetical protein